MVGPVDGAGVGWASEPGVLLPYVSAGRRRRILEGLVDSEFTRTQSIF